MRRNSSFDIRVSSVRCRCFSLFCAGVGGQSGSLQTSGSAVFPRERSKANYRPEACALPRKSASTKTRFLGSTVVSRLVVRLVRAAITARERGSSRGAPVRVLSRSRSVRDSDSPRQRRAPEPCPLPRQCQTCEVLHLEMLADQTPPRFRRSPRDADFLRQPCAGGENFLLSSLGTICS
jgi:hypothetical protein